MLEKGSTPPGVCGFVLGTDPAPVVVVPVVVADVDDSVEAGVLVVVVPVAVVAVVEAVVLAPPIPGGIVKLAPGIPTL